MPLRAKGEHVPEKSASVKRECEECDTKIQRDLIRARDWDYVAAAFGLDDEGRKRLRAEVIRQYGAKNELIVSGQPKRKSRKRRRRPKK